MQYSHTTWITDISSLVNLINIAVTLNEPQYYNHPNEIEYPAGTKDKAFISIKFTFPGIENYFHKN
jgi:hypothetical protein